MRNKKLILCIGLITILLFIYNSIHYYRVRHLLTDIESHNKINVKIFTNNFKVISEIPNNIDEIKHGLYAVQDKNNIVNCYVSKTGDKIELFDIKGELIATTDKKSANKNIIDFSKVIKDKGRVDISTYIKEDKKTGQKLTKIVVTIYNNISQIKDIKERYYTGNENNKIVISNDELTGGRIYIGTSPTPTPCSTSPSTVTSTATTTTENYLGFDDARWKNCDNPHQYEITTTITTTTTTTSADCSVSTATSTSTSTTIEWRATGATPTPTITVSISGPDYVGIGGSPITLTATGNPLSSSYTYDGWAKDSGSGGASFSGSGNTCDVTGSTPGDVYVTVNYNFCNGGSCCGATVTPATKKKITVFSVSIGSITRIAPTKTKNVTITTNPSPLPSGVSILLEIERISGSEGNATINQSNITQTTSIIVTGTEQSSEYNPNNIRLKAKYNGQVITYTDFTVCAHVTNFNKTAGNDAGGGIIHFEYEWDSDGGNDNQLDKVIIGEKVDYPGNFPDPPFDSWTVANPTIIEFSAEGGTFEDNHGLAGGFSTPYQNATVTASQEYRYKCNRCNSGYINLQNHSIARTVSLSGSNWIYTCMKDGVSSTLQLP